MKMEAKYSSETLEQLITQHDVIRQEATETFLPAKHLKSQD